MRVAVVCLRAVCLSSALLLAACGGGGGSSPAPESAPKTVPPRGKAAELLGNWRACTSLGANESREDKYAFTADSPLDLFYEYTHAVYPSADCSGAETGHYTQAGVLHIDEGTKQVGANEALRVTFWPEEFSTGGTISFNGNPTDGYAQLLAITAESLLLEGDRGTLDAEGYPTSPADIEYAKLP